MNKFKIEVVQPLQSPDLKVDDLAFSSILDDVSLVAKENRRDLIAAVGKRWYDYDIPRRKFEMFGFACVCCSEVSSSESGDGNEYQRCSATVVSAEMLQKALR